MLPGCSASFLPFMQPNDDHYSGDWIVMTIDAQELRRAVEDVLREQAGLDRVRAAVEEGTWLFDKLKSLSVELGWNALAGPEDMGGLDVGAVDLLPVHEEFGRRLVSFPLLPHTLCVRGLALARAADERLEALVGGGVRGAVAFPDAATELRFDGGHLNGMVSYVLDSCGADLLLVPAVRDGEACLLLVTLSGAVRETIGFADVTRRCERIRFDDVIVGETDVVATGEVANKIIERILAEARLALAADSVGGAQAIFDITLEYLCTRRQFGRLIGSFQALKHRCADLAVNLRMAEALLKFAAGRIQADGADAAVWAFMAKGRCASVYHSIAAEAIQMHGGMGFTWESDCHLFIKRAKLNEQLLGSPMEGALALAGELLAERG